MKVEIHIMRGQTVGQTNKKKDGITERQALNRQNVSHEER